MTQFTVENCSKALTSKHFAIKHSKDFKIFIFASEEQQNYCSFQGYLGSLLLRSSIKVKFLFRGTSPIRTQNWRDQHHSQSSCSTKLLKRCAMSRTE
jgi:hypothetical protein